MGCDLVCCGHTHHATTINTPDVTYVNSGCWTEIPCTYLAVADGVVQLRTFELDVAPPATAEPALAR